MPDQGRDRALEWGTATTPHPAQHVSGDVVIASGFGEALDVSGSPQRIAERILAEHWTVADDGLVLVLRYLGTGT